SIRLWPVQSAQAGASILVNDAEQQVNVSALLFDSEEQLWILNSGQSADKNVEHRWRQLQLQHFKALMIHSLDYFKAHINSALLTSAGQLMITTNHDSVERFSLSEPERIERWLIASSTLMEQIMDSGKQPEEYRKQLISEEYIEQLMDSGKQQQSKYPVQVLSLDGNRLATQEAYGAKKVQLWRLKSGALFTQEVPKQIESPLPITTQALNANGQWLATGTPNGIIHLWDLTQAETKIKPIALRGHDDAITKLIFSRDSQWLISGSEDNTVRLWQVSLDRLFELGCWAVGRHLTEAEWRDYFGEQPYRQTCEAYLP
ncbi:MAG: hypothetical protein SVR94_13950, partial [Pseudomonadota bacterium]|nr:hypothetical protein [Pseudomonadota bacterium]